MALILTIATNTFVTLVEANNYLEGKLGSTWASLTDTQKKQSLISSFRWLLRLGVAKTANSDSVKTAQIELAWWLYQNYAEYEDREALYASGVRSFRLSKWSENLNAPEFPQFIKDLIGELIGLGGYFPTITREYE